MGSCIAETEPARSVAPTPSPLPAPLPQVTYVPWVPKVRKAVKPSGTLKDGSRVTVDECKAIRAMYRQGMSSDAIGRAYGVSRSSVLKIQREPGYRPYRGRGVGRKLRAEQVLEIRQYLAAGFSDADIGTLYDVSDSTIHDIATGETWRWLVSEEQP